MHSTEAAYNSILQADVMHCLHPHPLFMSAYDRALAKQGREQGEELVVACVFGARLLPEGQGQLEQRELRPGDALELLGRTRFGKPD